ncbi:MAG: hypothetical protein ACM3ZA_08070 [Bacillota bacterium]
MLALPVGEARAILAAAGVKEVTVLTARPFRSDAATGPLPDASELDGWRVIRQRDLGPGQTELLASPLMRTAPDRPRGA